MMKVLFCFVSELIAKHSVCGHWRMAEQEHDHLTNNACHKPMLGFGNNL